MIWNKIETFITNEITVHSELDFSTKYIQTTDIVNLLVLMAKQYIYSCRCLGEKPIFKQLKVEFIQTRSMEFYYARTKGKMKYFIKNGYHLQHTPYLIIWLTMNQ